MNGLPCRRFEIEAPVLRVAVCGDASGDVIEDVTSDARLRTCRTPKDRCSKRQPRTYSRSPFNEAKPRLGNYLPLTWINRVQIPSRQTKVLAPGGRTGRAIAAF